MNKDLATFVSNTVWKDIAQRLLPEEAPPELIRAIAGHFLEGEPLEALTAKERAQVSAAAEAAYLTVRAWAVLKAGNGGHDHA